MRQKCALFCFNTKILSRNFFLSNMWRGCLSKDSFKSSKIPSYLCMYFCQLKDDGFFSAEISIILHRRKKILPPGILHMFFCLPIHPMLNFCVFHCHFLLISFLTLEWFPSTDHTINVPRCLTQKKKISFSCSSQQVFLLCTRNRWTSNDLDWFSFMLAFLCLCGYIMEIIFLLLARMKTTTRKKLLCRWDGMMYIMYTTLSPICLLERCEDVFSYNSSFLLPLRTRWFFVLLHCVCDSSVRLFFAMNIKNLQKLLFFLLYIYKKSY